jgi:hypothetical protein
LLPETPAKNSLEYFLHNDGDQTFSRNFIRKLKRPRP